MITSVRVKFDKLLGQTPRAYLLLINRREFWFPRKMCRNFILNKKLGGNMVVPTWLYVEKFGEQPDDNDGETIITHHIPGVISPKVDNEITELRK